MSVRSDGALRVEALLLPLLLAAFGAATGATVAASAPLTPQLPLTPPPTALPAVAAPVPTLAGYVRLEVADVILSDDALSGAVLLRGLGKEVVLPVFVPADTGRTVQRLHENGRSDPTTLADTTVATGGRIVRVELDRGEDGPVARLVVILEAGTSDDLEIAPGDALASALAADAPVFVRTELLEERGVRASDLLREPAVLPSHLRLPLRL